MYFTYIAIQVHFGELEDRQTYRQTDLLKPISMSKFSVVTWYDFDYQYFRKGKSDLNYGRCLINGIKPSKFFQNNGSKQTYQFSVMVLHNKNPGN